MKKLVLAAAVMMLVPFSAFALENMNDEALSSLTAQEGVTITFDNVVITQQAADTAWYDTDGAIGGAGGRVYVAQTGSTTTDISGSLSIDVATAPAGGLTVDGTAILADTSFVRISLPSISQAATRKSMTITMDGDMTAVGNSANFVAPAAGVDALGTLIQNGGTSTVAGAILIYAH